MKDCNLLNVIFLVLFASCTNQDADFEELFKSFIAYRKEISRIWLNWGLLFVAAACVAFMSIFVGLYIYRKGWRSLVPQCWRKTDN